MITRAHPEHSSGELKKKKKVTKCLPTNTANPIISFHLSLLKMSGSNNHHLMQFSISSCLLQIAPFCTTSIQICNENWGKSGCYSNVTGGNQIVRKLFVYRISSEMCSQVWQLFILSSC